MGITLSDSDELLLGKYCLFRIHFPLPAYDRHSVSVPNLTDADGDTLWIQAVAENYKLFYQQNITNAICLPSTCSASEINRLLQICE